MSFPARTLTAGTHYVQFTDRYLYCDTTGGEITLILPKISDLFSYLSNSSGIGGLYYALNIEDIGGNSQDNNIILQTQGDDKIFNGSSIYNIQTNNVNIQISIATQNRWGMMRNPVNQIIKIDDIDYTEINAAPADKTITFTIADSKPVNKFVRSIFLNVTEPFVSVSADLLIFNFQFGTTDIVESVTLNAIAQKNFINADPYTGGVCQREKQDTFISFVFSADSANPKDFSAGSVGIYLEMLDFPNLNSIE